MCVRKDQGQGGAQAIEDGIALGIALSGVSVSVISSCPSEIPQRLAIFEKARRDRASAIQILSNVGQEQIELIHKEVEKYVGFVPSKCLDYSVPLSFQVPPLPLSPLRKRKKHKEKKKKPKLRCILYNTVFLL